MWLMQATTLAPGKLGIIQSVTDQPVIVLVANVYVVGSGYGDGVYATYVGRTDFRVIPLG
jgi:hypothetical protein